MCIINIKLDWIWGQEWAKATYKQAKGKQMLRPSTAKTARLSSCMESGKEQHHGRVQGHQHQEDNLIVTYSAQHGNRTRYRNRLVKK